MWDGQNIFHEFEGWGGEMNKGWQVDEILDSLNQNEDFPKMIVVGIFNTENRGADYMPDKPEDLVKEYVNTTEHPWYTHYKQTPPNASNQLKFLVEELKPFVDKNYKTIKITA